MLTMQSTTRLAILCGCTAALVACAKKDEAPMDTTAMAPAPAVATTPAAPAPVNLADVAGKWDVKAVPTTGDTTPTTYVLSATGTTDGWTLTFPGRKPMAVKVSTDADSIMMDAEPYSSVRRKGVRVTTHSVSRLSGGSLVGTTVAHYNVKTADSVLTLNSTGTKQK
ncbi:MAG: hypothetical protein M3Z17_11515 [Gemmatimonadota bacterium]|nr:hypothetical protein [Gemmatimonadota bacterium]